jgi:MFS family permease
VLGLGKVFVISCVIFGMGIMTIAHIPWSFLAYCIAFPAGFGLIASLACINTLLQTLTDEDKRGRVMSFYSMGLIGMAPLGSMLFSLIEKGLGLSFSIIIFGFVCLGAALIFEHYRPIIRRLSRPAFVRQNIIVPEIAQGLQSTESEVL